MGNAKKGKILLSEETILHEAEEARDRLYRLQYVTTALTQAVTSQQIAEIVVSLGAATIHASAGSVWLFDEQKKLSLTAYMGYSKEQIEKVTTLREDVPTPIQDAIRMRKPVFLRSFEEKKKLYPHIADIFTKTEKEGFIAIPFLAGNTVLGCVNFAFKEIQEFTVEEQEFLYALVQQCSQAVDRARLYDEELRQKNALTQVVDRIKALNTITVSLSKALTPKEIGKIIIEEAIKGLNAIGGEITVLSEDRKNIKILTFAGYPTSFTKSGTGTWMEASVNQPLLMMDVIKTKLPLMITDFSSLSQEYVVMRQFAHRIDCNAGALMPLVAENNSVGVLGLFFKHHNKFTKDETEFLITLSQLFTQAYERAKMYEEEKSQKEYLRIVLKRIESLQHITSLLSKAVTLQQVLQTIMKEGMKILGANGGEVALLSEDKKTLRIVAYRGYPKYYIDKNIKKKDEFSEKEPLIMWEVLKKNYPFYISNIFDFPSHYTVAKKFVDATNFKSQATVPLSVGGEVLGCLQLLFDKTVSFTEEDKSFIMSLAQQTSQAIERSNIYEKEKRITESLRQSEENWRQLAETIPQLVWTGDKIGKSEYYNMRWEEYTGISQEKLIEKDLWLEVLHPDDKKFVHEQWEKARREKKPYEVEFRIRNKKGEYRWFLSKAVPIKNRKGIITRWFGTETDIHEKKLVTQEIERREARFRALIEYSSDAIVLTDANGTIIYSSPSTKRVTGYSPEEQLKKSMVSAIYPKDQEKVKMFIKELVSSPGDQLLPITYRRINKNGSIPWMEGVGRNMLHNQNIKALVINYRDITERIEYETTIKQSKDELEIIFENVADAVVVWDAKGDILYVNHAAAKLNRYSSIEEFVEDISYDNYLSRFEKIVDEEGHLLSEDQMTLHRTMREKKPTQITMCVTFRDTHENQWRQVTSAPIFDDAGNILLIVSVAQDITEEKQKEKLKDEFISTASHELKTPITSAKLYAGILSERIQQLGDQKTYTMITKLDVQLDRLTKLINDLLDVTKIKSGKIMFNKEKVAIENLLKDTIEEIQYTTVTHKLNLIGESKKIILLDKERMRQVIINLLTNAIKYSPDADTVDVLLTEDNKGVTICVKDYGVGIEKNDQENIFEPFYRSPIRNGQNFPGLGLGLHISSEIVKRHEGKMWVESSVGQGTKIYVYLPLKQHNHE